MFNEKFVVLPMSYETDFHTRFLEGRGLGLVDCFDKYIICLRNVLRFMKSDITGKFLPLIPTYFSV
jgi:hypothetical protein